MKERGITDGLTMNQLAERNAEYVMTIAELEEKCAALVAENAVKQEFIKTCFRAAADGVSMDGADIQEIGERLGLFGRETYQPVLHGYICGHEAGEDTVYVMKPTPTDAFLAEVRAHGVEMAITHIEQTISPNHETVLNEYAAKIRQEAAQ
ncbi:hypothetical protein ACK1FZ_004871 [Salmonella enterica]